jgi:hypothetical protein
MPNAGIHIQALWWGALTTRPIQPGHARVTICVVGLTLLLVACTPPKAGVEITPHAQPTRHTPLPATAARSTATAQLPGPLPLPTNTVLTPFWTPTATLAAPGQTPLPTDTPWENIPTIPPLPTLNPPTPEGVADVYISDFSVEGVGSQEPDEYIEITNLGEAAADLSGWTLSDDDGHVYQFPAYVMEAGESCRIYTNENHPEYCGFSYGSTSAIWDNDSDCIYLRDATDTEVDAWCY